MTMFVLLNEENRIVMTTREKQNDEQFEFDFPSDFAFSDIINWKIVNGELIYDEIQIPELEPIIPLEDRVDSLEEYTSEMLYQLCLLQLGLDDDSAFDEDEEE